MATSKCLLAVCEEYDCWWITKIRCRLLYSMVVFTINLWLIFYRHLFLSTLLAPKRVQKAQHRQNQSLSPRLTNFRKRKCCLRRTSAAFVTSVSKLPLTCWHELSSFVARLSATFPQKDYAGVCKFSRATARQKNFTLLSAPFTAAVACDFDSAVIFESNLCCL